MPHAPFAFNDAGTVKGLEIELINEYTEWVKTNKKQNLTIVYREVKDFDPVGEMKKSNSKTIGLCTATINQERQKEVDFTTAYLQNVSFCITNGNAPDAKVKSANEVTKALGSMTALTIDKSSLSKYVTEIKKTFLPELPVKLLNTQTQILDNISKNVLSFGYVDAVEFWFYLKSNPGKFLKIQKPLNQSKEQFGFLLPKGSPHKASFDQFFTEYKASPKYKQMLEKYLGSYMMQTMALK
jgi:ABC-type amino acid transport substrate-binding protein